MTRSRRTSGSRAKAAKGRERRGPTTTKPKRRRDATQPRSKVRLWLFRFIAATVIPALLLLVLVASLRILGVGYPTKFYLDATVDHESVYQNNPDFGRRFFPDHLARSSNPFSIPAEKPAKAYRIFVLGASAAQGAPDTSYSLSRVLEYQLRTRYPQVEFQVINTAMVAINSHVVLEIIRDCVALRPDLFVVYLGNNEVVGPYGAGTVFAPLASNRLAIRGSIRLRSMRLGQLIHGIASRLSSSQEIPVEWGGMTMFLENQVPADAPSLDVVYRHYHQNLLDICRLAQRRSVPIIVCTLGANLKDCPPFASLHRPDLSKAQLESWEELYRKAIACENRKDYRQAIELLQSAAKIDDRYADLHFRMGRCYWLLKDYSAARDSLLRARDQDTLRFRSDSRINEIVGQVSREQEGAGVYLVDVAELVAENSPHGIPGQELFLDHVHYNFSGNYLAGTSLFYEVDALLPDWIKRTVTSDKPLLTEQDSKRHLAFTSWNRWWILDKMLRGFLMSAPFTNQLYHEEQVTAMEREIDVLFRGRTQQSLQEDVATYRWAIEKNSNDMWLHYNYSFFLLNGMRDFAGAEREGRLVLRRLPQCTNALQIVLSAQIRQGKVAEALRELEAHQEQLDKAPAVYVNVSARLIDKGRSAEAMTYLKRALQVRAGLKNAHTLLGWIFSERGDHAEALEHFRAALAVDPSDPVLHINLGKALAYQGQWKEATAAFRDALKIDPELYEACDLLARVLRLEKQIAESLHYAEKAVVLSKRKNASVLANLAMSLAAAGRFDQAVAIMEEAIEQASKMRNQQQVDSFHKLLKLYQQGKDQP